MGMLNKESPCVIQMIKDVRAIYEAQEDGSGRSCNINVDFLDYNETFLVGQETEFQMPTGDGGVYWEKECLWHKEYTWNEMTMWCFDNRPFTVQEFKLYNEDVLKQYYVNSDEIKNTTIDEFVKFAYDNPWLVPDAGHCHSDLKHNLF